MADLEWEGRPERPILRRAIRHRLRRFAPTIRVVAEGFLAETSTIDLLAVGGEGEFISIRIGRGGDDERLLTHALADQSWLRPRLADFLKIAPGLGIEPSAEPRAILFCPSFTQETRSAAENFPARSIELLVYHCFRHQGQLSVLLETTDVLSAPVDPIHEATHGATHGAPNDRYQPHSLLQDPPSPSGFRTGLSDDDLRIELEEEKIFE